MITVEQVLSWDPCEEYDDDTLQEIATKIEIETVNTTAELIRRLQGIIPAVDILWLVLREELIPTKTLHELSCWFAAVSLHRERNRSREPDFRSWDAVETKWQWTQGRATDGEREVAEAAAMAATRTAWAEARAAERAAREVAWATWAETEAAARAAWAAVGAAAEAVEAAAMAATRAAAKAAARERQLKMVLSVIERSGE